MGCRGSLDPTLLWLWHRLATIAPIQLRAWEFLYATDAAPKRQKKKKKKKKSYILSIYFFWIHYMFIIYLAPSTYQVWLWAPGIQQ